MDIDALLDNSGILGANTENSTVEQYTPSLNLDVTGQDHSTPNPITHWNYPCRTSYQNSKLKPEPNTTFGLPKPGVLFVFNRVTQQIYEIQVFSI